ncbi:MAG: anti-sigma factor [Actinomycetota bacterium]|nr:anti-sigma factor [Actinomycetota bacterium]
MTDTHEEMRSLIAPYVLGSVSSEEDARVRSHIMSCEECFEEAESLAKASSSLAMAVEPVAVPPGFEDGVLARVREMGPENAESPLQVRPVPARKRWGWAGAGFALAALFAVFGFMLFDAKSELGESRELVVALLAEDGIEVAGSGATGKLVDGDEGAVFVARGLSAPPEGKIYQLWRMTGGCAPERHGPCGVQSAGPLEFEEGLVVSETGLPLGGFDDVAVTVEEEEVEEPTGAPIMSSFEA